MATQTISFLSGSEESLEVVVVKNTKAGVEIYENSGKKFRLIILSKSLDANHKVNAVVASGSFLDRIAGDNNRLSSFAKTKLVCE